MSPEARLRLRIPSVHTAALAKIAELSESEFTALRDVLATPPTSVDPVPVVTRVSDATGFDEDTARMFVSGLWSAEASRARNDWSAEEVVDAVVAEASETGEPPVDLDLLRQRLLRTVELEALSDFAKGVDLLTDYEHVFYEARIITDVRMVFPQGDIVPGQEPHTAVLVHMLRVTAGNEGGSHTIVLALDAGDLDDLKNTIARAEAKAEVIREIMERANVSLLDIVEPGDEG